MADTKDWDFYRAEPPSDLSDPLAALWWLAKGNWKLGPEWENAHEICQSGEGSRTHDLVHALAHWIEGDNYNSDYWYRRRFRTAFHKRKGRVAAFGSVSVTEFGMAKR